MDTQEVRELYEAYMQVHQPQELTEEVEIAAQYFYEMGLNEEGVEILIEELGVEEFGNFVYDLAEEYTLSEASETRLQRSPLSLKGPKGSKPQSTTKNRVKRQGGTEMRTSARPKGTVTRRSGNNDEERSERTATAVETVETAKKKQPAKKGSLGGITDRVREGMKRHNQAVSDTGKTLYKVGKAAGKVAGGFVSGVGGAAGLMGHLARKGLGEEVEAWVSNLLEEGYDLSEYTWDDMCEMYLDEARRADREGYARGTAANPTRAQTDVPHSDPSQRTSLHSKFRRRSDEMGRARRNSPRNRSGGRTPVSPKEKAFLQAGDRTSPGRGHVRSPNVGDTGRHSDEGRYDRQDKKNPKLNPKHSANRENAAESFDLFDTILEHLVAEGYADTNEAALVIMANMSEEWRQSIVEGDALQNTIKYLEGKRDAMNANKSGSANTAAPGKQSVGAAAYKAYQRLQGV
jgi:hypothetical protein